MHRIFYQAALAAVMLSLGMATSAFAQGAGDAPKTQSRAAESNAATQIPSKERKFIEQAAVGSMAEIQVGKLAQEKASSQQVKELAARIVDDHTKALEELKQVATAKGANVPTNLERKHQRAYDKLQKLSGAEFDREFVKDMVSDHKKEVKEFKGVAESAKDADIKNFASKTLPTLQQHLQMAQAAEAAVKKQ